MFRKPFKSFGLYQIEMDVVYILLLRIYHCKHLSLFHTLRIYGDFLLPCFNHQKTRFTISHKGKGCVIYW